ncbi:MAG: hypothetical protein SOZ06_01450 [Candidatus Faecenecus gallistercoris]|nr:hypothetical protein [Bacillota bacterium]MDD7102664.1 hypothetical protein [Bacillota bacterium]MDY4050629.1 hypothetical protein [Candidatus Faecenecus gallistercoris]
MKKNRKKENKTKWIIIGLVIAIVVGVIIYLLLKTPASLQEVLERLDNTETIIVKDRNNQNEIKRITDDNEIEDMVLVLKEATELESDWQTLEEITYRLEFQDEKNQTIATLSYRTNSSSNIDGTGFHYAIRIPNDSRIKDMIEK